MLGRRLTIEWWAIAVAISAVIVLAFVTGLTRPLDVLLYDRIAPLRAAPPDRRILLVEIDDFSLSRLGRWPWTREIQAQALARMIAARPAAIGYDVLFVEPASGDAAFAAAMEGAPVLLPVLPPVAGNPSEPPPEAVARRAAGLGQVALDYDGDGLVRTIRLGDDTFAELIARTLSGDQSRPVARGWRDAQLPWQPAGSFRSVPYASVLAGEVPDAFLKDRILLVGATAPGLGDLHPVPASAGGRMSGVEIQANILNGLLADRLIRLAPNWACIGLSLIPAWLMMMGFWYAGSRLRLAIAIGLLLAIMAAAIGALVIGGLWIRPAPALLGLALTYPLWSWRRLDAINRFLQAELLGLRTEPGLVVPPLPTSRLGDSIGQQTMELHAVIGALRSAMHEQERTLQFLSHDMRAPQAAILTLLESSTPTSLDAGLADRLRRHARHGLALAEDFVQLARLRTAPFVSGPVDMGDAFAEATDMIWHQAQAKRVRIDLAAPDAELWVSGDRWALVRTLANLIDNAVKFSPEGSTVTCRITAAEGEAICSVADCGPGLPPERRADPFAIFGHRDRCPAGNEGVGLGLAFAQTTIERHGGAIEWESAPGKGTRFVIRLPLLP